MVWGGNQQIKHRRGTCLAMCWNNHRDANDLGVTLKKVGEIRMGRKFNGRNGNLYIFNTGEMNWRLRIFY